MMERPRYFETRQAAEAEAPQNAPFAVVDIRITATPLPSLDDEAILQARKQERENEEKLRKARDAKVLALMEAGLVTP